LRRSGGAEALEESSLNGVGAARPPRGGGERPRPPPPQAPASPVVLSPPPSSRGGSSPCPVARASATARSRSGFWHGEPRRRHEPHPKRGRCSGSHSRRGAANRARR